MNRIENWPAWLKGMLIPPLLVGIVLLIAGLLLLIGFGAHIKVLSMVGLVLIFLLQGLSSLIGGSLLELGHALFSLKIATSSGGGTPTLAGQLVTVVFLVLLGGLIGWVYGRITKT